MFATVSAASVPDQPPNIRRTYTPNFDTDDLHFGSDASYAIMRFLFDSIFQKITFNFRTRLIPLFCFFLSCRVPFAFLSFQRRKVFVRKADLMCSISIILSMAIERCIDTHTHTHSNASVRLNRPTRARAPNGFQLNQIFIIRFN